MRLYDLCGFIDPASTMWVVSLIAAWLVLICLKTIAEDLGHALRWRDLQVQANRLRQQQVQRLKELGIKHGRRG
jgi:hypothetical protein